MPVGEAKVLRPGARRRAESVAARVLRRAAIDVLAERGAVAEPAQRFGVRVVVAQPKRAQLLGAHREVEARLVFVVADEPLARRRQAKETADTQRQLRNVSTHHAGSITPLTAAT